MQLLMAEREEFKSESCWFNCFLLHVVGELCRQCRCRGWLVLFICRLFCCVQGLHWIDCYYELLLDLILIVLKLTTLIVYLLTTLRSLINRLMGEIDKCQVATAPTAPAMQIHFNLTTLNQGPSRCRRPWKVASDLFSNQSSTFSGSTAFWKM